MQSTPIDPGGWESQAGYIGSADEPSDMDLQRLLLPVIVGLLAAALTGLVWLAFVAPPPGSVYWLALGLLAGAPACVIVGVGTAITVDARLAGRDAAPRRARTADRKRMEAAGLSILASVPPFVVLTTWMPFGTSIPGLIALAIGFGLGAIVAVAVALVAFRTLSPTGGSLFGAGPAGEFAAAVTVVAACCIATFSVGLVATALLADQYHIATFLVSIPIGVGAGLVTAGVTAWVLRRHIDRLGRNRPDSRTVT